MNEAVSHSGGNGNTKELAARLMAVQACYQMLHNDESSFRMITQEYLNHRTGMSVEGHGLQKPDGALFKKIMGALEDRLIEIDELLYAHIRKKDGESDADHGAGFEQVEGKFIPAQKTTDVEPLLRSILFCGICEILVHTDIDHPVVINDYLHIAHAFYEKQQVAFVNGILDSVASLLRSGEPV